MIMERKRILLAAVVWALMLLSSVCQSQENQIINGEFDAGIEPWQRTAGDGFNIEVVQDANLSGTNALKIDVLDATAQESIMISQGIFVLERGAKYHIGFMAKADTDRQIGVLLEQNGSWAYAWHEWIDLMPSPQTFSFEFIHDRSTTENVAFYFILKHSLFPLLNENENIDVYIDSVYVVQEPPADPNLAHYPWPSDGAMHPETWICCSWTPGQYASTHDVYFGETFDDVNDGTGETFMGNQSFLYWVTGFPRYAYSPGLIPGTTYYWRIDEFDGATTHKGKIWSFSTKPAEPNIAHDPYPADGAMHPDTWVTLTWSPGRHAVSHDFYFGYNFEDVNNGTGETYFWNQTSLYVVAGFPDFPWEGLIPGTTYYWLIDEVNNLHPDSPWKGDVWSFGIPPYTAYDPFPADGAEQINPNITLSWKAGLHAELHSIYFGDDLDDVNDATVGLPQETTTYSPGPLEFDKTYY
jgi:hypothetical protein